MEYLFINRILPGEECYQVVRYIEERGCCVCLFWFTVSITDPINISFNGYIKSFYG